MSYITPTHLNYYHVCHRKLWLYASGITMEHTSDAVYEGKLIGENTYSRRSTRYTELDLGIAKIDFYDVHNRVVHEIKKSDKMEPAHIAQVKYYLFLLHQQGIEGASGLLEYPRLRKTTYITLASEDILEIQRQLVASEQIMQASKCPEKIKLGICRSCSYFDFCWVAEENDETTP